MTYSSQEEKDFFAAVGRLTIMWAHLELALDAAISVIHQRLGGADVKQDPPIHLARKIKYLKRCLHRIPQLAHYRDKTIDLLITIDAAIDFRKDIVRGAVTRLAEDSSEEPLIVTPEMILAESEKVLQLGLQVSDFAVSLCKEFLLSPPGYSE